MPYAVEIGFVLLPASLLLALSRMPRFFEGSLAARLSSGGGSKLTLAHALIGALLLLPLSLLALAGGSDLPRYLAFAFSTLGALWGGKRLAGAPGVVAAACFAGLAWLLAASDLQLLAFDLTSLLAALGGGALLAAALGRRALPFMLLLFALDCVVVSLGLTEQVVAPAMLGPSPELALAPPIFAGIAVDGIFLGAIDIAAVVLVAAASRRSKLRLALPLTLATLLGVQAALVLTGVLSGQPLPATLPALAALLVLAGAERRHARNG